MEDNTTNTAGSSTFSTVQVFTLFLLSWQSMFRIANIAVSVLLRFFSHYLSVVTQLESIRSISKLFPNALDKAQKIARLNRNDFRQYVCCSKCFAVYTLDDCFERVGSETRPKVCCAAQYPKHPWPSMRAVCGAKLLKAIKVSQKEIYNQLKFTAINLLWRL